MPETRYIFENLQAYENTESVTRVNIIVSLAHNWVRVNKWSQQKL